MKKEEVYSFVLNHYRKIAKWLFLLIGGTFLGLAWADKGDSVSNMMLVLLTAVAVGLNIEALREARRVRAWEANKDLLLGLKKELVQVHKIYEQQLEVEEYQEYLGGVQSQYGQEPEIEKPEEVADWSPVVKLNDRLNGVLFVFAEVLPAEVVNSARKYVEDSKELDRDVDDGAFYGCQLYDEALKQICDLEKEISLLIRKLSGVDALKL